MAKKRYYNPDATATLPGRKRMESESGSMISEDHSKIANLPTEVMFKEYPKRNYDTFDLDDTIETIDHQTNEDIRGGKKKTGKYPEKY